MSTLTKQSDRTLFEILVAVAWLDGIIQPEEKVLLNKIATEHNLEFSEDLLNDRHCNSSDRCYDLLTEYLGQHPTSEDYDRLLVSVSSLIYSDNDIATEEASFLNQIQNLDPNERANPSTFDKLITKIQKLYRKSIDS